MVIGIAFQNKTAFLSEYLTLILIVKLFKLGASVECTKGCWSTSSERINGLLNARVNPAELQQGEHKIELNCHAYLSNNESAVIEWFVISDGGEVKISYSKAKAGNYK